MKKLLVFAVVICCTFGLFAKFGDPKPAIIQPTFGVGPAFSTEDPENQFGISVGADVDWNVWEKATTKAHDGSGKMYAGLDLAFEYWVPTHDGDTKWHIMRLPLQGNFMYEFDTSKMEGAGPLKAVGPWMSMGVSLDFGAFGGDGAKALNDNTDNEDKVRASFVWGIGASLAFEGNWVLKGGFGGNAGGGHHGWHWNTDSHFMAEVAYRF